MVDTPPKPVRRPDRLLTNKDRISDIKPPPRKPFFTGETMKLRRTLEKTDFSKFPLAEIGREGPTFAVPFTPVAGNVARTGGFAPEGFTPEGGRLEGDFLLEKGLPQELNEDLVVINRLGLEEANPDKPLNTIAHEFRHRGLERLREAFPDKEFTGIPVSVPGVRGREIAQRVRVSEELLIRLLGAATGTEDPEKVGNFLLDKYSFDKGIDSPEKAVGVFLDNKKIMSALMLVQRAAADEIRKAGGEVPIHFPTKKERGGFFSRLFGGG